ncbi:hypothetical protein EDB89DRAFT_2013207 [Lactarius sanguifluus]|nr:hypothetical protein EDB89DRAFT_2013207 [Lactarius sanguifluus]
MYPVIFSCYPYRSLLLQSLLSFPPANSTLTVIAPRLSYLNRSWIIVALTCAVRYRGIVMLDSTVESLRNEVIRGPSPACGPTQALRPRLVLKLVDLPLMLIMVKIYTCYVYKVEERLGRVW